MADGRSRKAAATKKAAAARSEARAARPRKVVDAANVQPKMGIADPAFGRAIRGLSTAAKVARGASSAAPKARSVNVKDMRVPKQAGNNKYEKMQDRVNRGGNISRDTMDPSGQRFTGLGNFTVNPNALNNAIKAGRVTPRNPTGRAAKAAATKKKK
jgi:hypothetical protein